MLRNAQVSSMDLQHPRSYLAAVSVACLAGLLLAAAAPPAVVSITALPSLLVLFVSIKLLAPHRDVVWPLFAYLFVGWGISYGWILDHAWPQTALVSMLLLALVTLIGAILARTGFRLAGVFGVVTAMMLYEAILTFGPVPMPLVSVGYTAEGTSWAGLVSLFGITGVSFLMWGLAALAAQRRVRVQIAVAVLWVLAAVSGLDERIGHFPSRHAPPLSIVLVQPGTSSETWADIYDDQRVEALVALSGAADGLWIWPETALPIGTVSRQDSLLRRHASTDVISGGIVVGDGGDVHNAAVYWRAPHRPENEQLTWNGKRRLIPLVEFIPGLAWMPWLRFLRVDSGGALGYSPGGERAVWNAGDLRVSALVCFESLFASEARAAALGGAQLIVVLSNDGWWESDRMQLQHRDMTALVARATGRTIVMAGVSGWSGVLSETGRMVDEMPMGEASSLRTEVRPHPRDTLYLAAGESFSALFFLVVVCLSLMQWKRHD